MISVAIIGKNEADVLERCLKSVQGAEIIFVDTGSTDTTKDIAIKYADKVFDFEWCEDFSKARNFAIEQCSNEWVLILDCDEWIDDISDIEEMLDPEFDSITADIFYNGVYSHNHIRIIKKDIRYTMPIHEYPLAYKTKKTDIRINHSKGEAHVIDKERNKRMLLRAVANEPDVPRYKYYLACEYYWAGEYNKAIEMFTEYVGKSTYIAERADAYLMMAKCKWIVQRGDEAREDCMRAIILNPQFVSAYHQMSQMVWPQQKQRWQDMAATATNEGVLFNR